MRYVCIHIYTLQYTCQRRILYDGFVDLVLPGRAKK